MRLKRVAPIWVKQAIRAVQNDLLVRRLRRIDGVKVGRHVRVDKQTDLEGRVVIGDGCNIIASSVGRGSYICAGSSLRNTCIGRFCSISRDVVSCFGQHPSRKWVSTHPAFFSTMRQAGFCFADEELFEELPRIAGTRFVAAIGHDVWLGARVSIMDGVTIGNGAIVGAGAVVTRDLEPYSVNVGVPARRIRYRFTQEQIALLERFRWWDRSFLWLRKNAMHFRNIDDLVSLLSQPDLESR